MASEDPEKTTDRHLGGNSYGNFDFPNHCSAGAN
jgi:hypothetical protein